jgi:hypothetical protein
VCFVCFLYLYSYRYKVEALPRRPMAEMAVSSLLLKTELLGFSFSKSKFGHRTDPIAI